MAAGKYKTDQNYDDDIEFIKDSDAVQGDPVGTDPDVTPLTGPINVVIQKIVSSLAYLKNAIDNASIARMTDSVFGTGRTATQNEAENGTAHGQGGPLLTPQRGMQLLRGSAAQATTTRRGTAEFANATEAVDENNTTHMLTPQRGFTLLRSSQAQATESQRGTVRRASQSQARALTDTERYLSVALLLDAVRNASGLRADTSNYGVTKPATLSEVNNGTETKKHLTPDTFKDSDAIQSILPASDLPTFRQTATGTNLSFDSDIIGNFGVFKVTLSASGSLFYILTDKWIPINVEGNARFWFYNESNNAIEQGTIGSFGDTTSGWSMNIGAQQANDIIYILMLKIR